MYRFNYDCVVKKYGFVLLAILLLILKLYIIHDLPIIAIPSPYDEYLMVNMAENIASGKWLGAYSQFTFIKGITYPVFLTVCYYLHIPAVIANSLLYALAVVIFILAIRPLIKRDAYLFSIYMVMLLSPISYATDTIQRIYRDDIYYSLILILVSCYVAVIVRDDYGKMKWWIWLLTIDFIAVMFCREDSIWVVPIMIAFSVFFIKIRAKNWEVKRLCKMMFMPFVGAFIAYIIFATINFFVYGKFIINEMQYSSFTKAYESLCSIQTEQNISKVKLSNEAIEKAYVVSPTFRKLKAYYDGIYGDAWRYTSSNFPENDNIPKEELGAATSMWALRDFVDKMGFYDTPQHADEFYNSVIWELNEAEKSGALQMKKDLNVPLFSSLSYDEWLVLGHDLVRTMKFVFKEEGLNLNLITSPPSDYVSSFENITCSSSLDGYGFSGWILSKHDVVKLDVALPKVGDMYHINKMLATDVVDYYARKNQIYPKENFARFHVNLSHDDELPFYLEIRSIDGGLLKSIPINFDDKLIGMQEDDNFAYCIDDVYVPSENDNVKLMKEHADLTKIVSHIYAKFNAIFIVMSLALFIFELFYAMHIGVNKELCVLILLWSFLLLRIFVIAYNTTTAFYSISYVYLSPCYPLMAAIAGFQSVIFVKFLLSLRCKCCDE